MRSTKQSIDKEELKSKLKTLENKAERLKLKLLRVTGQVNQISRYLEVKSRDDQMSFKFESTRATHR